MNINVDRAIEGAFPRYTGSKAKTLDGDHCYKELYQTKATREWEETTLRNLIVRLAVILLQMLGV